jgi:hypothetical protein
MSSCGTTLKEKGVEPTLSGVEPTISGVEVATTTPSRVEPTLSGVEPTLSGVEPTPSGVEVATTTPSGVEPKNTDTPVCPCSQCKCQTTCLCVENRTTEPSITLKLNPTVVPLKFTRYRHPSHRHRLFMIISFGHNSCNNKKCGIQIRANKTIFRCFRCDYDLCGKCFQLGTTGEPVPLAEDDNHVDETTVEPISSWCVEPEY